MAAPSNKITLLLDVGEEVQPGDEFYDDDFGKWEPIKKFESKVTPRDVVRRQVFDPSAVLKPIIEIYELADRESTEKIWWDRMDTYIAEAKRRIGIKTLSMYDRSD